MRFCVLGSGSRGNCTYVEAGKTRILIDAGFSGIEIERRLSAVGVDISSLSAILTTHEHSDHVRGIGILSRKFGLPVFANHATFRAAEKEIKKTFAFHEFSSGASFHFQDLRIHPFSISHDAADPVGFVIENSTQSIGYCTDTGAVSRLMRYRLAGCNGLVLESNHDLEMLKNGPYPYYLKQRVRSTSGHLANGEAAGFLEDLLHDGLTHVVLAHISETNNTPQMVQSAVEAMLSSRNGGNGGDFSTYISLAAQDRPGRLLDLELRQAP
ncbi:MAG: MBL fold metallo-hydrolase [Desulfobulbaceae bacterium]|nr:MBL fold metallo-hydrolase [Desulfobulbaceae bacterium]